MGQATVVQSVVQVAIAMSSTQQLLRRGFLRQTLPTVLALSVAYY
jgi:hypothetical protein